MGSKTRRLGAAAVEYIVVAAVILAVIIGAVSLMRSQATSSFGSIAELGEGNSAASQKEEVALQEQEPAAAGGDPIWALMGIGALVLAAGAGLALLKKKPQPSKKPEELNVANANPMDGVFEKRQQIMRVISNNREKFLEGVLEVQHAATMNCATISPSASKETALQLMAEKSLTYLPVCDPEDGTLLGLVSSHFLKETKKKYVGEVMIQYPYFVAPNTLLSPTITQMMHSGIDGLAVVEDGRTVGLLTTRDIQLTMQAVMQTLDGLHHDRDSRQPVGAS